MKLFILITVTVASLGLILGCTQFKDFLSSPDGQDGIHELEEIAVDVIEEVIKEELK